MEIIIESADLGEIANKVLEQDVVTSDIIMQITQISSGTFRDDGVVKFTNSEKDLGTL